MNILYHIHSAFLFIFLLIVIFINTNYLKYIAFIPLFISFTWILFDGCILDKYDGSKSKFNDRITPLISFLNKKLGKYVKNHVLTGHRPHFVNIFKHMLILTIIVYRVIFNINFF